MSYNKNMIDAAVDSDPVAFQRHFGSAISNKLADRIATKKQEVAGSWLTAPVTQEEYEAHIEEELVPDVLSMIKQQFGDAKFNKLAAVDNGQSLRKIVHKYANLNANDGAEVIAAMAMTHISATDTSLDKKEEKDPEMVDEVQFAGKQKPGSLNRNKIVAAKKAAAEKKKREHQQAADDLRMGLLPMPR